MTLLRYDEAGLLRGLNAIPVPLRVAFAAACAERLLPAYETFSQRAGRGDPATIAGLLEQVWQHLLSDPMAVEQIRAALERCMVLIPGEDDEPWVNEQPYGEDAAAAVAYALRALENGEPQEAAWAARRAYEALDHHVINRLGIEGAEQVVAHPLVQAELARQRRDLAELRAAREDPAPLIARLRDRAGTEAAGFFGSGA